MPKRKKTQNQIASPDDSLDDGEVAPKKRRKQLDSPEILTELYEIIRNHKTQDGRLTCETFIKAPKKKIASDYYEVVSTPIDLLRIQQKLKGDEYQTLDQFSADIELMVNNAKSYYKKNTVEYKDACELWDVFINARNEMEGKENEDEDNVYEQLFSTVMTAEDSEGRNLSTMFRLLPSRQKYPEYYKVILEPIDLKTIATKIVNHKYHSLNDLEKDLLQMCKNAKIFNEPGSQIYKDAAMLRKIISGKKFEIDQRRAGLKVSERIRAKTAVSGEKWSLVIANIPQDEYDSSIDDDTDDDRTIMELSKPPHLEPQEDLAEHPLWELFNAVKNYQGPDNETLSDPFLKLPSKKFHSDYYKEIKHPISINKIEGRIKDKMYSSPMELVDDFNTLFENAKKYNRPDSKIFKDAVKLQKVMQSKASELINITLKDTESEDESSFHKPRKAKKLSLGSSSGTPCVGSPPPALSPPSSNTETPVTPVSRRGRKPLSHYFDAHEIALMKKLKGIYKHLIDYTTESGRNPIVLFMEKPNRKDYPDYYEVISNPIDMKTIEHNIKTNKYPNVEALVSDFKLMFNNCRQYNEEGSEIYQDAVLLERHLMEKLQDIGLNKESPHRPLGRPPLGRPPLKKITIKAPRDPKEDLGRPSLMKTKLKNFYETIKEYTDNKGRKISNIFLKLPSKTDYPEYYEVIKRPMNLEKIFHKFRNNQYENLEEMLADFLLMFDNACKYNEPDSQIYKDALTLQRLALKTKMELSDGSENGVPDVRALVQELLTNLFISVYNYQDDEGRCFSDSIVEWCESLDSTTAEKTQRFLTLDRIKRFLDKGRYRRLDKFQEDMFEVFEQARVQNRTDSQAFEDSVILQSHFIKNRDQLCRNGTALHSPALNYGEAQLQASVETLKAEKLPKEPPLEVKQEKDDNKPTDQESTQSLVCKGNTYRVGDFVYIEPREKGMEPHIICIERLWKDKQGEEWIYGNWYYRPVETFHLATRKFYPKEVFRSDARNSTPLSQVIGRCHVMKATDYFKYYPEGFDEKDVYVCEFRYNSKVRHFTRVKIWHHYTDYVKYIQRPIPLQPIKVPSTFSKQQTSEPPKEEKYESDDNSMEFREKPRPNVIAKNVTGEEGAVYYEQLTIPAGTFKLGDACYVRTEHGKTLIGRIDKMWIKNNNPYFHGPWFVTPQEVQHTPNRLFYKQEVFLSSIEDTNPLLSVISRCAVLDIKDYVLMRPTEIAEQDVYVCESRYQEAERQIRKLTKGLKKFNLSPEVTEDELYFFRKSIVPQKEMSPASTKTNFETDNEESCELPALGDGTLTPQSSRKKIAANKRLISGYVLFACEMRKQIMNTYPDKPFGEQSRLIGNEWRQLTAAQKAEYEEKAQKQNEEMAALKDGPDLYPQSPASGENSRTGSERGMPTEPNTILVYECHWDQCDFQFENVQDLGDHLLGDSIGHLFHTYPNCRGEGEYQCLWRNCVRVKKNVPPFPNIQRLIRHLREVHFKASSRNILPEQRSRNFVPANRGAPSPAMSLPPHLTPQAPNGLTPQPHHHHHPPSSSLALSHASPHRPYAATPPPPHSPHHSHYPISAAPITPMAPPSSAPAATTPLPHYPPLPSAANYMNSHPPGTASSSPYVGPPLSGMHRPLEPLFVATPPRTQRILHSSTYIKYIEGLQADNKHISNWDAQLKATKENTTVTDARRLPVHWLANGAGNHGNALNALWALRDFMLKDALNLSKIL